MKSLKTKIYKKCFICKVRRMFNQLLKEVFDSSILKIFRF